jgi:hypothetical protein
MHIYAYHLYKHPPIHTNQQIIRIFNSILSYVSIHMHTHSKCSVHCLSVFTHTYIHTHTYQPIIHTNQLYKPNSILSYTYPFMYIPILNALSTACLSSAGFQEGSKMMTLSAPVRGIMIMVMMIMVMMTMMIMMMVMMIMVMIMTMMIMMMVMIIMVMIMTMMIMMMVMMIMVMIMTMMIMMMVIMIMVMIMTMMIMMMVLMIFMHV